MTPTSTDSNLSMQQFALLLLRLVVVSIFLYHGIPKAINWAMASEKFIGFGLPGFLGPITGIVEVIASVLILIGIQNFWANWVLVAIMAGEIATVQFPKALSEGAYIAGLERDLMILVACAVSTAFGPGAFALKQR
ncbi:DoxX family protein [Acaryochloris sp. 'Moss Beach']|uniref:DoxX family protein n=1 Tax=Acaryochloris sp. 'Moss Beach' TaxID=2740837 RepID=UPI001F28439A|nr:DoxX family protein [Acaryochloris sp. 'Moss Beach']UJB70383.1 DoxX family protein [Acaryochloris sp. 'Moss Beach']